MRDLGMMGESAFSLWCNSVGLIPNGSAIDKTGWDFFVEFPLTENNSLPADMLPSPLECKVQVKATDQNDRKEQITVSNLHRLVKTPIPAFICFIEFGGKNEAQAVYLVHIDQKIIEKTLQRIRELEVKGQAHKLNKKTITIKYTDKERLKNADGKSLKEAIERYVPHGAEEYINNKNSLMKTLGYETGSGQFDVTISGIDPITDMIDLTLGLREKLNVDKFVGRHQRFGILSPKPFVETEKGILVIPEVKPFTKAVLTFKEHEFSPSISFSADFFSSQLNQVVPEKYLKFRAKGRFFEIVFEPFKKRAHYTFQLNNEDGSNLTELRDMLKILTLLRKSASMLLEIKPEGLPPLSATINSNEIVEDWSVLYNVAEMAISICQMLQVQTDDIMVNVALLIKHTQSIKKFYNILKGTSSAANVEFTFDGEDLDPDNKIACIFYIQTHIGDHAVGRYLGVVGFIESVSDKRYKLNAGEFIFGSPMISKQEADFGKDALDKEFNRYLESVEEKALVPIRMM